MNRAAIAFGILCAAALFAYVITKLFNLNSAEGVLLGVFVGSQSGIAIAYHLRRIVP